MLYDNLENLYFSHFTLNLFSVNIGDLLEMWTAGLYPATLHRLISLYSQLMDLDR